jgi:hypothetical protein
MQTSSLRRKYEPNSPITEDELEIADTSPTLRLLRFASANARYNSMMLNALIRPET